MQSTGSNSRPLHDALQHEKNQEKTMTKGFGEQEEVKHGIVRAERGKSLADSASSCPKCQNIIVPVDSQEWIYEKNELLKEIAQLKDDVSFWMKSSDNARSESRINYNALLEANLEIKRLERLNADLRTALEIKQSTNVRFAQKEDGDDCR